MKDGWPAERAIDASKAAIRVAALIPETARKTPQSIGSIVLTQSGTWEAPDPTRISLPVSEEDHGDYLVHRELASDEDVARDLKALGC